MVLGLADGAGGGERGGVGGGRGRWEEGGELKLCHGWLER